MFQLYTANKFQSGNFIPIKFVDSTDGNSPVSDTEQKTVQDESVHGEIVGYLIDNPGSVIVLHQP